ncbi:hypothetical protein M4578_11255 [Salipiger sp. P9]|uniref:hypothetical protein n=1 Tax=Salipiger pentaromativorans TaxID=2943193 RepID=UPI00215700FD|nr:hypothetical protein [Salipiger pentaromativorans]MCR8548410.1 hypothetical protein [Salipiger pentaromativorans]
MIELLFVACLSTAPDQCQERSLLFTDITPMTCVMGAQPELAKWTQTHPAFTVTGWKCRSVRPGEKEA